MYWGSGDIAPALTPALNEGEWSASRLTALPPGRKLMVPNGWDSAWAPEP